MEPQPPRHSRGCFHTVLALFVVLSPLSRSIEAQTGPRISHDGLRCMLAGEHLILEALVEPTGGLATVKVYFRANLYRQFYYVEMVPAGDVYQGVLPKPRPEITRLHYYLEAMDSSFNSVRTAEFTPQIVSNEASCRERNPSPAAYLDGTGAITVGSTGVESTGGLEQEVPDGLREHLENDRRSASEHSNQCGQQQPAAVEQLQK